MLSCQRQTKMHLACVVSPKGENERNLCVFPPNFWHPLLRDVPPFSSQVATFSNDIFLSGKQKQGHALVKARGFLGSVYVWLTSLLWCFDMCYWRPLFWARPATNLVSKFWPVPLWSLRFLASGSEMFHNHCHKVNETSPRKHHIIEIMQKKR